VADETFSELEQLWEEAGGSAALAPYAAATAENESSGITDAYNASGATGLWQIEYPDSDVLDFTPSELDNPLDNAKAAVALSKDTLAGLESNWTAYEGKTPAQVEAEAAADQKSAGQTPSAAPAAGSTPNSGGDVGTAGTAAAGGSTPTTSGDTTTSGTSNQGQSAIAGAGGWDPMSLLDNITGLARDLATVIDYVFGMFGRGQGWRLVMTLVFAAAAYGSYRALVATGAIPDMGKISAPSLAVV